MLIAMIIVGCFLAGLFWGFPLVMAGADRFQDPEGNMYALVIFGIGTAVIFVIELILLLVGLAFNLL